METIKNTIIYKNVYEILEDIKNAKTYHEVMAIKISHLNDNEYSSIQMLWDAKRRNIGGIGLISETTL